MADLSSTTRFDSGEVEPRITAAWMESGIFHPEAQGESPENYSIAIPPPNVTGALHMGHALNGTVQDVLARWHRMRGRPTKWILGTDHAGIATQTQVEKRLRSEGSSREELGRDAFIEKVWEWRQEHGSQIVNQFQRLGASCDYSDERFTLDDAYAGAVQKVFIDLHAKGFIYRDNFMVNWDPGSGSAISDLEVEQREVQDTLYSISYDLAADAGGPLETITIATVRPETLLGDSAIAVNPSDDRYRHLVGREAILPLIGRRLVIIADEYVKVDFGTGVLKITPAHDPNDFEIGRVHGLDEISVIGEDGRMTSEAGEAFAGLTALEAREAVVAALDQEGRIVSRDPYVHEVPFSHRSGERIEPLISLQWFMRMDELAKPAMAVVRDGKVKFTPQRWGRVYLDWLENIRPWCISRQLWWGHQLPVWYREGETYVGMVEPEGEGWERDPDVLDTWFSSALWPFATLGWPQETPEMKAFYPTNALSTARDIIFLWVARMVMMGLEFTGKIPFQDVYIHSVIQAPDGRRMSKSLGTGIDPLDEIDRHGADAVRFGLMAMSSTQDVRYSVEKVNQGQQLANKLFNASRFILLGVQQGVPAEARPQSVEDRWILSRLEHAGNRIDEQIANYDFAHAALTLYEFVYSDLCDWYLELVKPRIYDLDGDRTDLSATLLYLLAETLTVAHPLIPFVTEELWGHLPGGQGMLAAHQASPAKPDRIDQGAEAEIARVIGAVQALRGWRDSVGVPVGEVVAAQFDGKDYGDLTSQVARLARLDLASSAEETPEPVASVGIPDGVVHILAAGAFDPGVVERKREAQRTKIEGEITRSQAKLANKGFVAKAPAAVVEAEQAKLDALRADLETL